MVTSEPYVPDRGDIVWVELTPPSGPEQAGRGPALVFSPKEYNRTVGLAFMCPISIHVKGYPFEVPLPTKETVRGVVLADHIKSLDWRIRNVRFLCRVPVDVIRDTVRKFQTLLVG